MICMAFTAEQGFIAAAILDAPDPAEALEQALRFQLVPEGCAVSMCPMPEEELPGDEFVCTLLGPDQAAMVPTLRLRMGLA